MIDVNLHHVIIEHPQWFTSERLPNTFVFLRPLFLGLHDWSLKKIERDSLDNLKRLQFRRLKRLVLHAYNTVPFWREHFENAKIDPREIDSFEKFSKIPITNKKNLQSLSSDKIISRSINRSRFFPATSFGTTGRPLSFYVDNWCHERRAVTRFRAYRWQGAKEADVILKVIRNALFYERSIVLKAADFQGLPKVKEYLYNLPKSDNCVLDSYPSFLVCLADLIKKDSRTLPLRSVIASAESVSQKEIELLREIFLCPVGKRYTSREGGGTIAQTCKEGNFHVNIDQVHVEIVDSLGMPLPASETGKIILTNLNDFTVPFIRYELGDLGSLSLNSCACKSAFPILNFEGRNAAVFNLPDGRTLHSFSVISLLHRRREWIKHYQVIRTSKNQFNILIVPSKNHFSGDIEALIEQFEDLLGSNMNVSIELVSTIRPPLNGKFKSFVSLVKEDKGLGRFEKYQ